MTDFFFFSDKRHHRICTPENLVRKPDIDTGNIFDATNISPIKNDFAGHAHTVSTLYTDITLPQFIFTRIQRISADILQCFLKVLSGHQIGDILCSEKFFAAIIAEKYRSSHPKAYLVDPLIIPRCFQKKLPDIACKKILYLFRSDRPHPLLHIIYVMVSDLVQPSKASAGIFLSTKKPPTLTVEGFCFHCDSHSQNTPEQRRNC